MLFICSEREDKICKYLTNARKYCQMFDELIYSDVFSNGIFCMLYRIEFVWKGFY